MTNAENAKSRDAGKVAAKKCPEIPRYDGPPLRIRSMGWTERKLRLFAGSGWNGEHPTGYGWARALLAVGERLWWK